jgi:hypothetical protein
VDKTAPYVNQTEQVADVIAQNEQVALPKDGTEEIVDACVKEPAPSANLPQIVAQFVDDSLELVALSLQTGTELVA